MDRSHAQRRVYCSARCRRAHFEAIPANRIRCVDCGEPTGYTPGQERCGTSRCLLCETERMDRERDVRGRRIEALWADGLRTREIAARLGTTPQTISTDIHRLRARGFDLPYRRRRVAS